MNPRKFKGEDGFYCFEPPWTPYENGNVFIRISRLYGLLDELQEGLENLNDIFNSLEEMNKKKGKGYEAREAQDDIYFAIEDSLNCVEVFGYCFPELFEKEWFDRFWQDLSSLYWRLDEDELGTKKEKTLLRRSKKILEHTEGRRSTHPFNKLIKFLERYGIDIYFGDFSEEFQPDVFEARDQFCLGYYSTALFVLGRAVERAMLMVGEERKIESVRFGDGNNADVKSWEDAKFSHRVKVLSDVDRPGSTREMINSTQFNEGQILVDYRNKAAHSEYEDLDEEKAERKIHDALDLLGDLCQLLDELREMDDDEIESKKAQKVQ